MKKSIAFVLAFFLLSLPCALPAAAAQDTGSAKNVIRVGYPSQPGLTEVDEDGKFSGYSYEYLQEVAQYTGWEYEFVQVPGSLDEQLMALLDMMDKGEIDLMSGMLYSDALNQKYDYISSSYGTVYTTLNVLSDDPSAWGLDFQIGGKMRVAVTTETGARIDELKAYCDMNQIEPQLVLFDTMGEQVQALRDGLADAILSVSLNPPSGTRDIARFAPRPFYFTASKGNSEMVSQLNSAVRSVEQMDPYFSTTLFDKYFSYHPKNLILSSDEKEYLKHKGTFRVGVLLNMPPFQYLDAEGKLQGISIDLLQYIAEQAGFAYTVVTAATQDELMQLVAARKVDFIVGFTFDYDFARQYHVAMTRPYTSAQYMLMLNPNVRENNIVGKRRAMPQTMFYGDKFSGNTTRYQTQDACIRAVNRGDADYTYVDGYAAQYYVNQPEFSRLRLVPLAYDTHKVCFGVVEPIEPELLNILNKAVLSIPTETMQNLVYNSTSHHAPLTLLQWFQTNPSQGLLIISGILLCIIGALLWGLRTRTRMNRRISLDMKKYIQVYELASESFFEYDYQTNRFMISAWSQAGPLPPCKNAGDVLHYDLAKFKDADDIAKIQEFVSLLKSCENGVTDMYLHCWDESHHWLRFTIKTVYDGLLPAYAIGKIANIDEEKLEKDKLLHQAQRDSLTHLLNAETCRREISQSLLTLNPKEHGALILMDIDYFKTINDTYGHLEGDRVLQDVASSLRELFREDDIIGRPGGDEFTVYMRRVKDSAALRSKCTALCERIRTICFSDGRHLTCSIGAALSFPNEEYDALFRLVDAALYSVKREGRDRFEIAAPAQKH